MLENFFSLHWWFGSFMISAFGSSLMPDFHGYCLSKIAHWKTLSGFVLHLEHKFHLQLTHVRLSSRLLLFIS